LLFVPNWKNQDQTDNGHDKNDYADDYCPDCHWLAPAFSPLTIEGQDIRVFKPCRMPGKPLRPHLAAGRLALRQRWL
jgi:hypothetical protein